MTRFFDIVISFVAILILLPFMIPIMIGLKLTGEHDIFYRQTRVGRHGRDFQVIKFATMLRDSPNMVGGLLTQKTDPRILPMGGFLRKTKINELPQLLNIFVGEMSFVGPRPQARKHFELYDADVQARIQSIRPGLTGLGSLVFHDEEGLLDRVEGDRDWFHDCVITPYKGRLEAWYEQHRSLWVYFAIIAMTAIAILDHDSKLYRSAFRDLPEAPKELAALF